MENPLKSFVVCLLKHSKILPHQSSTVFHTIDFIAIDIIGLPKRYKRNNLCSSLEKKVIPKESRQNVRNKEVWPWILIQNKIMWFNAFEVEWKLVRILLTVWSLDYVDRRTLDSNFKTTTKTADMKRHVLAVNERHVALLE